MKTVGTVFQTYRHEVADHFNELDEDNRRLVVRGDIKQWNQMLAETAHNAGVITNEEFAIFQNAGYMGLYGGLDVEGILAAVYQSVFGGDVYLSLEEKVANLLFNEIGKSKLVKEIYNMKKVCLAVLPALTIVLELLPLGAVCIFATSPTERVKETFSYFSLTPFGYANFAPLITATLTVAIFLLSLFSLKKKGVLKALFVLSIITVVISLLPLMYGLNYYTLVGAFITVTLVIESILAKIQQK